MSEQELAPDYLRKLIAERDSFVVTLPIAGIFENLRDDPQFVQILCGANV